MLVVLQFIVFWSSSSVELQLGGWLRGVGVVFTNAFFSGNILVTTRDPKLERCVRWMMEEVGAHIIFNFLLFQENL